MTEKMNKIQIRAQVFSSVNNILSPSKTGENTVNTEIEKLKKIEDKDFLSKLLIKEFINTKDTEREAVISLILLNCIPVEDLEKNIWSNLSLKTVSDEKKYQLVEILKSMGKFIEYDKYLDYFDEPQKIIDIDTNKLLSSAMLNPEAQIDFLDFMETLSPQDKILLIQSMVEDYSKDDLANIIAPIILYETNAEILELVINELINSKSALAFYPIKRFSELSKNETLVRLAKKGLKEFQLAGITEDKAKQYYNERFNNSLLYNCFTSLPDGKGNQGFLFSRIRNDNSIQIFCTVINDIKGITDCFGFNSVSPMEYTLILNKFSNNKEPFKITFETALDWLKNAENLTFKNDSTLPYEYICWKEILFDVPSSTFDVNNEIPKALTILPKAKWDLQKLFLTDYLDKLFFKKNDNNNFQKFMENIDAKILETEKIDLSKPEEEIKNSVSTIFDEETKNIFIQRLQKIAFILMSNSKLNAASMIFELSQNEKLLNEFFIEVIKKSLFVYYEEEFQNRFNYPEDNVFIKNTIKNGTKLDNSKLKNLLEQILADWGQDG